MLTYFLAGWFGYESVLGQITADIGLSVLAGSVQDMFMDCLSTAISCSLIGVSVGFGAGLSAGQFRPFSVGLVLVWVFVSIVSYASWFLYKAEKLMGLPEELALAAGIPVSALPIAELNLYEIGLLASGTVLVLLIVLLLVGKRLVVSFK